MIPELVRLLFTDLDSTEELDTHGNLVLSEEEIEEIMNTYSNMQLILFEPFRKITDLKGSHSTPYAAANALKTTEAYESSTGPRI